MICNFVESQVYIFNINSVAFKSLTKNNKSSIIKSVCKVIFIVSLNLNIDWVVFIVSLLQISTKSFVSFDVSLLTHVSVLSQKFCFDKFSVLYFLFFF